MLTARYCFCKKSYLLLMTSANLTCVRFDSTYMVRNIFNLKFYVMKYLKLAGIILVVLLPLELTAQKGKYNKVIKTNTIEAYKAFLDKYPDSEYNKNIRSGLIDLEFVKVKQENTKVSYEYFLSHYPNSKYDLETTLKIEEFSFIETGHKNTIDGYYEFLKLYPNGQFSSIVKDTIISLKYQETQKNGSIEAYKKFLELYPETSFTKEAKKNLSSLEYEKAIAQNTVLSLESFIKNYPNSSLIGNATNQLSLLIYPKLKKEKSVDAYKAFIQRFPNSKFLHEVQIELVELEFNETQRINTYRAYQKFIQNYPEAAQISKANQLREQSKEHSYYITSANFDEVNNNLRSKYPEAYIRYFDNILFRRNNDYGYRDEELERVQAQKGRRQFSDKILRRPINSDNYEALNMLGCWLKSAYSRSPSQGNSYLNGYWASIYHPYIDRDDEMRMTLLSYVDEWNSNDPEIVALKNAYIDMYEDIMTSKNGKSVAKILSTIYKHEKNQDIKNRINQILEKN